MGDPTEVSSTGSDGKELGSSSSSSSSSDLSWHHPCYYVQLVLSSFLRCLGFDLIPTPSALDPPTSTERGKKAANDDPPVITLAARRPTRPPPNPGRGGQTN